MDLCRKQVKRLPVYNSVHLVDYCVTGGKVLHTFECSQ
jgi:hypothetical protein